MPLPALSLAVVGAPHPNKRGPTRIFELALCIPGEPVELRLEPNNPADRRAVAVFSCRGVQIGYLTAERCGRIGAIIRSGHDYAAIFQWQTKFGAVIRIAFDGEQPKIPARPVEQAPDHDTFWPDDIWPDD